MEKKQLDLLIDRLILETQKYSGCEPISLKEKKDLKFCQKFFNKNTVDLNIIKSLLTQAIKSENEFELDLILMLLTHFSITKSYSLILSSLLIQPWHHFHDRIANILEFDMDDNANNEIIHNLYLGALYTCNNLDYESDYCEFNRKCLYALAKSKKTEAINYIKNVSMCNNTIVAAHAKNILLKIQC